MGPRNERIVKMRGSSVDRSLEHKKQGLSRLVSALQTGNMVLTLTSAVCGYKIPSRILGTM